MDKLADNMKSEVENAAKKIQNLFERRGKSGGDMKFKMYTPAEGHPDWDKVREKADELVKAAGDVIEFDTGTVKEKVAEAARVSDSLAATGRSMIKNYRRYQKGDHTLLPPFFIWTMHNKCNFRCTYCDNHRGEKYFDLPNKNVLDTEKGKKLLDICRRNVSGIYFCGGEPTLRKDLPELTDYAHSINYFPLVINTNGSRIHKMLVDPDYSKWLKQMDILVVSLDALNIDTLQKTWGMKKDTCEQVIANILALRKLQDKVRFKLIVNTVITPETIAEADKILDWACDMGIWYSPVPMNCGPEVNSKLVDNPAYQALADKIIERKKQGHKILGSKKLITRLLKGDDIKCFPSLKPHVDPDGSLLWPCKPVANYEPKHVNLFDYDSLDDAYIAAAKELSVNNFHGQGAEQCGADCNWMQNFVSDTYARGIKNPIKSGVLLEIAEFIGAV